MTKSEWRKKGLALRLALDDEQRKRCDVQIRKTVEQFLDSHTFKHIGIFLPIAKFNEIDLYPLLSNEKYLWYIPKSFFDERRMEFMAVNPQTELAYSEFMIPEPKGADFIDPTLLDLIVIPLLISDRKHYRVGYGKGFYDEFLKRCRKDCFRLGVNYFEPVYEISDLEDHDEPMHHCIFPEDSWNINDFKG